MLNHKLLFGVFLIFLIVINQITWSKEPSTLVDEDKKVITKEKSIFDFFFQDESINSSSDFEILDKKDNVRLIDTDESTVSADITVVRVIDTTLGKLYKLEIPNNDTKSLNELKIKAISCWIPPQKTLTSQARASIEVTETRNRLTTEIFKGWIFAHAPAINIFSHPKYDIQLETCKILSIKNIPISK